MSTVKLKTTDLDDGRRSLFLQIYHNGKSAQKRVGIYLEKETTPEMKKHNKLQLLEADKIRVAVYEDLILNNGNKKKKKKDMKLDKYFNELVTLRYNQKRNYETWRSVEKHLLTFLSINYSLEFQVKEMSIEFLEEFKEYLLTKLSKNSVAAYFDVFKSSVHEAFRKKLIEEDYAVNVKSAVYQNPHREFLTIEEVRKLIDTECEMEVLKDAFIYSCFTGLRFSDVQALTFDQIEHSQDLGTYIRFKQKKTKESLTVPLNPTAIEIIEKYRASNTENLVFSGLIYSAWNNLKLREWVMRAGIKKKVTFHVARHTFATLLLQKGASIYEVSKILGHSDIKTTEIYAKIVDESKREAVNLLPYVKIQ